MLSFDLRSLDEHAVQVDATLPADDAIWMEADPRPVDGVRVTGRLSAAGPGRFYFSGRIEGQVGTECRRCLADVAAHVAEDAHFVFAEAGDAEIEDDPDVYHLDPRSQELDLRPAVREQWLLDVPAFVVCRDDCRGLCPSCGADLNAGPCGCAAPSTDPRWDALRGLRDERS
ncbi:MAG TPA: DUF177 domain-containing protein [Gemmatimonadales bacterium]